jgi:tyrosyl-tRNA synthetase
MNDTEKVVEFLQSGTVNVYSEQELIKKLKTGKPLRVKFGADPTAPDLHLGHVAVLNKMRQFQDLGHDVIFLIGDFTAQIGDPTGKDKTRPPLTKEAVKHNLQSYFEQVGRILDKNKITICFNSEWLEPLTNADLISILSKVTLARIIERDDFAKRINNHDSISMHELLYPILMAYDSVVLKADVELGGTDQTFNLLMGRFLQEQYNQPPQIAMTMPLLIGLDGTHKMSKSLGNYVGLNESAQQAFGKLMSMSDTLMWHYFAVLLGRTQQDISCMEERVAAGNLHPMELKKEMAYEIIARFWSEKEAIAAREQFEALFQKHDYSQAEEVALPHDLANPVWIVDFLKALGAVSSSSEAKRLIEAKAVRIDDVVIDDFKSEIAHKAGMIVKVGKHRIYKLVDRS